MTLELQISNSFQQDMDQLLKKYLDSIPDDHIYFNLGISLLRHFLETEEDDLEALKKYRDMLVSHLMTANDMIKNISLQRTRSY